MVSTVLSLDLLSITIQSTGIDDLSSDVKHLSIQRIALYVTIITNTFIKYYLNSHVSYGTTILPVASGEVIKKS